MVTLSLETQGKEQADELIGKLREKYQIHFIDIMSIDLIICLNHNSGISYLNESYLSKTLTEK